MGNTQKSQTESLRIDVNRTLNSPKKMAHNWRTDHHPFSQNKNSQTRIPEKVTQESTLKQQCNRQSKLYTYNREKILRLALVL